MDLHGQILKVSVGYGAEGEGGYDWIRIGLSGLLQDLMTVQLYTSSDVPLSNVVEVDFGGNESCLPGQSGHQVAVVDFTCVRPEVCG